VAGVTQANFQRIEPTFGATKAPSLESIPVVSFKRSLGKTLWLIVISIAMTGACAAIAFRLIPRVAPGSFAEFAGYLGMLFFSLATGGWIIRLFQAKEILQISIAGIRDSRISSEAIAWAEISDVRIKTAYKQKLLSLHLRPEAASKLRPPVLTSLMAKFNLVGGRRGWDVSMTGLNGSFDDLLAAVSRALNVARH
jgi:hypothetical protein